MARTHSWDPLDDPLASLTPLVGRERELRQLHVSIERMLQSRSQVVLLAGEPGIGKTRLAEEAATHAGQYDALVLWGSCYEWEGAPAYWPWIQLVRTSLQQHGAETVLTEFGDRAAALVHILPELRVMLPTVPELPPMSPEQARFYLFESVSGFITQLARHQPLVLVLDDLHWADTPSLLLLQFLARDLRNVPLLLLGTYRNVDVGRTHPLTDTLAELARLPDTQRIPLYGLGEDEVAQFITQIADHEPELQLVETIYQETEGNPFFVTEVVRLLLAEGRLTHADAAPMAQIHVPESVRHVIGHRLNRLPDACNRILGIASVIGREFALSILARVADEPVDQVLESLDPAVEAKLIEERDSRHAFRFSHAMVQETLYAEQSAAQRMRLHRRVGEALEASATNDLSELDAELAYHFSAAGLAGDVDKAIHYATAAGDRAMTQVAFETAAEHYQQALNLLDLSDSLAPRERCELLLSLGRAQNAIVTYGDSPAAQQTFYRAVQVAQAAHLPEYIAQAVLGYTGPNPAHTFGRTGQLELLETALEALGPDDSPLRARLLARLAADYRNYRDDVERSFQLSDAAIQMAERLGDPDAMNWVLEYCSLARWLPNNLDERIAYAQRRAEVVKQVEDLRPQQFKLSAYRLNTTLSNLLERGNVAQAWDSLTQNVAVDESTRSRYLSRLSLQVHTLRAFMEGRISDAEHLIGQQRELAFGKIGPIIHGLAFLCRAQARLPELREAFQRYATDPAPTALRMPIIFRAYLALTYLDLGARQEARREFDRLARHDFRDIPQEMSWFLCMALASDLCAELGDEERAHHLYDLLLPYQDRFIIYPGAMICYGSAEFYLARLASTTERWELAEWHFAGAIEAHERTRTPFWLAQSRYAYADMLVKRGVSGDHDQALTLVDQALTAAREMGMTALAERAEPLRDRLAPVVTPSRSETTNAHGLSPRELEVLHLLVQGISDKEIAETLFISPRTVTTHVSHILDKLDVDTRTEAATCALRDGLV